MNFFYCIVMIVISCISIVKSTLPKVIFGEATDLLKNVTDETVKWTNSLGIFPGTKWCGPGNIAKNYEDLGKDAAVDKCCRAHDHCPHHISSGETKYNFHNKMKFTVSDCACDEEFKICLEKSNGNWIKMIYFSFKTQCIVLENDTAKLIKLSDYQQYTENNKDDKNLPSIPTNV